MKKIPEDIKRFLLTCMFIGVIGAIGLGWTYQRLTNTKIQLYETTQKIELLQRQGALELNLDQIKKNEESIDNILKRLTPILVASNDAFNAARSLNPETWKKLLNEKLAVLDQTQNLPKDFCYGFRNFKDIVPENEDVFHLGIQLWAAEELYKIMYESKLSNLKTLRRAIVEKKIIDKSDFTDEKIEAKEFYFLYPFELDFSCKPEGLRRVLNGLLASKLIFVPKSIEVVNPHDPRQTLKNILRDKKEKSLFVLSGEEDIEVKMKLNFLLWKM